MSKSEKFFIRNHFKSFLLIYKCDEVMPIAVIGSISRRKVTLVVVFSVVAVWLLV